MHKKTRIAFHTLGCKLNFAETSTIARLFETDQYEKVSFGDQADICIINTCSVTDSADKKSRTAIRKAIRSAPGAKVVVVGCYSELKSDEVATIEGVDLVLGTSEKFKLKEYIEEIANNKEVAIHTSDMALEKAFIPSWSMADRTRSFLKIQDGCNYFCSYCTIPFARGRSRNGSIEQIISAIREIGNSGIKEVILSGINIGDFGRSTGETFTQLIKEIESQVNEVARIRISSIEPNLITNEILELMASSSLFAHHLHIPLQSGSDKILSLMNRKYTSQLFAEKVKLIKEIMPDACIGTDVIVGFPGETDDDFRDVYSYIESLEISHLHVFSYSERQGTKASSFPEKVKEDLIRERSRTLQELSEKKEKAFYKSQQGKTQQAIFESKKGDLYSGLTGNYIRVTAHSETDIRKKLLSVKLTELDQSNMVCIIQ